MADISQFKDRKTDTLYNIKDAQARAVKEDIDRPDNTDGMAKIVIKTDASFASQLTQGKTTFVIRNNFDLNGNTITMPADSVLQFDGGSISNGTLVGNHTVIEARKGIQIFDSITIQGTWEVEVAYSSWFKMYKQGYRIASVAENSTVLYKGTDNEYYDFEDLTKVGSDYYVTSTLEEGEVVEGSIKVTATTYSTFKVAGDNNDYIAATQTIPGAFDFSGYVQYDDTAALQSLFDIRARKTIVEDGVYMINCNAKSSQSNAVGLYYDGINDSELVLNGWLKAIPNNLQKYHMLDVIGCKNIRITGKGGVQGDLLEHTGTAGEWGMCLSVSNTKGLYVEGLTFAYAWGDCVYTHWWSHGRESVIARGNNQSHHIYYNVRFLYGGRTGYVVEMGDNVVVDSCYFYGTGYVRSKETKSAIDIEPFGADVSKSYVRNYEFKNNTFEHSRRGLRIERCINVSIHDNYFDEATVSGIEVYDHKDVSEAVGSDVKWTKPILRIYNNNIRRAAKGIYLALVEGKAVTNADISNNLLVSCPSTLYIGYGAFEYSEFHHNTMYGCGRWQFDSTSLKYCDFHDNKSYATNPQPVSGTTDKFGRVVFSKASNVVKSKFHDNYFSFDYGKMFRGLGTLGTEEIFHGPAIGNDMGFAYNVPLNNKSKWDIYNNYISDDFFLPWMYVRVTSDGLNSLRDENSEVFIVGDTFKSSFGDEGTVTGGYLKSCSWLTDARTFEANMEVTKGEVVVIESSNKSYYKLCVTSGTCGDALTISQTTCGTAVFSQDAAEIRSRGTLAIRYNTRGYCTSSARPETFNFKGRKMYETDTGKNIMYDGSAWVYEDETPIVNHGTEDTGTSSSRYAVTPKVLHVWGEVASLYLSLKAGDAGFAKTYTIQFTSGATATVLNISGTIKWVGGVGPSSIEASKTYLVTITNGIGQIQAAE